MSSVNTYDPSLHDEYPRPEQIRDEWWWIVNSADAPGTVQAAGDDHEVGYPSVAHAHGALRDGTSLWIWPCRMNS